MSSENEEKKTPKANGRLDTIKTSNFGELIIVSIPVAMEKK